VGQSVVAEGWIVRARRRLIETRGHVVDADTGTELATGDGLYVAADPSRRRELQERYGFRFVEEAPVRGARA
jgi:hypothetical protein